MSTTSGCTRSNNAIVRPNWGILFRMAFIRGSRAFPKAQDGRQGRDLDFSNVKTVVPYSLQRKSCTNVAVPLVWGKALWTSHPVLTAAVAIVSA